MSVKFNNQRMSKVIYQHDYYPIQIGYVLNIWNFLSGTENSPQKRLSIWYNYKIFDGIGLVN